jgi:hypothetical protein
VVTARVCLATPAFVTQPGMDDWCQRSCLAYPPSCPKARFNLRTKKFQKISFLAKNFFTKIYPTQNKFGHI